MEPNEWRVVINDQEQHTGHDYGAAVTLARQMRMASRNINDRIDLQGRVVTPWRDVEIPYPPDNEEVQA
jgi:hypothetical protein